MSHRRCQYADASQRGSRSCDCFPGTFATHAVKGYFIKPRRSALYLCRAHADEYTTLHPLSERPERIGKPVVEQAV